MRCRESKALCTLHELWSVYISHCTSFRLAWLKTSNGHLEKMADKHHVTLFVCTSLLTANLYLAMTYQVSQGLMLSLSRYSPSYSCHGGIQTTRQRDTHAVSKALPIFCPFLLTSDLCLSCAATCCMCRVKMEDPIYCTSREHFKHAWNQLGGRPLVIRSSGREVAGHSPSLTIHPDDSSRPCKPSMRMQIRLQTHQRWEIRGDIVQGKSSLVSSSFILYSPLEKKEENDMTPCLW